MSGENGCSSSHWCWTQGQEMTIDEQFVPFHRKCSFWQYMLSNTGKYGIILCMESTDLRRQTCQWHPWKKNKKTCSPLYDYWTLGPQYHVRQFFTNYGLGQELLRKLTVKKKKRNLSCQPNFCRWRIELHFPQDLLLQTSPLLFHTLKKTECDTYVQFSQRCSCVIRKWQKAHNYSGL